MLNIKDKIVENLKSENEIDLVVFSGDLLHKPCEEGFKDVKSNFIIPLLSKLNLPINKCMFTIGNHDVNLNKRDDVVFEGIKTQIRDKKSKKTLSEITKGNRVLAEFQEYSDFINELKQKTLIQNNILYTTNIMKIKEISVGHAALNTSLLMEGSLKDYGNLYLDESILIEAYNDIKSCSIKILNLHHPLDWLKNKRKIEKLILDKFNIVFFGHEHQHDGQHITDIYNRDIISLNATSLYHGSNEKNGFSLYKYSIDGYELSIEKKEFNRQHNIFETIKLDPIKNINLMKKAPKAIRNKHICSIIYPNLKDYMNRYLAINLTSERNNKDIERIYVHPKIIEENEENKNSQNNKKELSLEEIINFQKNLIIMGKKESGKTTLLNMINIHYLKNRNDYIPINISGRELYQESSIDVFVAKVSDYLKTFYKTGRNHLNVKQLIEEKRLVFLVDDIQNLSSRLLEEVVGLDNLVIASSVLKEYDIPDENLLNFDSSKVIKENFIRLSLKPMRKKEKKRLTQNIVPVEIQDKITNKVIKTISKLRLPSNPFVTTLLAWMYTEKIDIRENEPQIIDVFLDYLLEKADLSKTFNGKIDFHEKKDIISEIAFTYYSNNSLAIKEDKIVRTIIDYSEEHFAFEIDSTDILEYFYQRRILIKNGNLVQFSYRVFYYYFITLYMISDNKFYEYILNDKNHIVNMVDELRYYSALKRDDTRFLDRIEIYIKDNRLQKSFEKLPSIEQRNTSLLSDYDKLEDEDVDENSKDFMPVESRQIIQEAIDEIETDAHEKKVDNYNTVKTLETESLKFPKEEFFILNMIYSEFIKSLSGTTIGKTNKEKYFLRSIRNYSNIIRYWEEQFKKEKVLKKFFKIKFPNDNDIKDDVLNKLKRFTEVEVLSMITSVSDTTLSTPKMVQFYSNILEKEESCIYERFFALIFSIETIDSQRDIVKLIKDFIGRNTNMNINKILQIKLYNIIGAKQINASTAHKIKQMLIELEFKIHHLQNDKRGIRKKDVTEVVERNIELTKLLV